MGYKDIIYIYIYIIYAYGIVNNSLWMMWECEFWNDIKFEI
jgi:hypothetical protein